MPNEITVVPAKRISLLESQETFERAWRFCEIMADTDVVPKQCRGNPGNLLARVETLMSLGVTAFIPNLNGVAVVNGVPSIWGSLLVAICQAHPSWNDYKVEWLDGQTKKYFESKAGITVAGCRVTAHRKGRADKIGEFTVEEAQRAGLLNEIMWKKYLPDMLKGKAMRRALHMQYADALCGIQSAEDAIEGQQIIEAEEDSQAIDTEGQKQGTGIVEPEAPEESHAPDEPKQETVLERLQEAVNGVKAPENNGVVQAHEPTGNGVAANDTFQEKKRKVLAAFASIGKLQEDVEALIGKSIDDANDDDIDTLRKDFQAAKLLAESE